MQTLTLNENQIAVMKSENVFAAFIRENRNPQWLVNFCRTYPGACFLSWIQAEFGRWVAEKLSTFNDFDLSIFENEKGKRKKDAGLSQLTIDFHIFQDVERLIEKGYHVKNKEKEFSDSAFMKLQGKKTLPWKQFFIEKNSKKKKKYPISASQISFRYYRFKRFWIGSDRKTKDNYSFQRMDFIDNGTLICGPTRIDAEGKSGFGFWKTNLKTGQKENYFMFETL